MSLITGIISALLPLNISLSSVSEFFIYWKCFLRSFYNYPLIVSDDERSLFADFSLKRGGGDLLYSFKV